MELKYLIFSSVDETFLDNRGKTAIPPGKIDRMIPNARLIFSSSRTLEEIAWLQDKLRYHEDFIAENGGLICTWKRESAAILGCTGTAETDNGCVYYRRMGAEEAEIRRIFDEAAAGLELAGLVLNHSRPEFVAEAEMISVAEAFRALSRRTTLIFSSAAARRELDRLRIKLAQSGCSLERGAKWWLVRKGESQGETVRTFRELLYPGKEIRTVGIGNAPDDREMMAECEKRFAIKKRLTGHCMEIAVMKNAVALKREGLGGWMEMLEILKREE
jgi:predicted mannosyl-3-phosphoglycerate phosphatase (HAD superfamily)